MERHAAGEHAGLAALAAGDPTRQAPPWLGVLAALLPLVYYIATASAFGYWYDAGEFVAAARTLGIAHPPGQPLSALFNGLFALLPIGPLSFRVAVGSAVALAAALGFAARAIYHALSTQPLLEPTTRALGSLGLTWLLAAGAGVWLQGVRPEVYALQAALSAVVLDGLARYERDAPGGDLSALYVAAVAEGLALANHHFLALLLLPAAAPTLARALLQHGGRALSPAVGFGLLGLCVYLYLPLRAAAEPVPNFGAPSDLSRLYWVVSAQAFQNTHALPDDSLATRMADVGVALVETLGFPVLLLAVLGLYGALRMPRLRNQAVLWATVIVLGCLARAWLGFVRHNPDAMGYLVPVYLAFVVLAAFAVALALRLRPFSGTPARLVCAALVLFSVWRLDGAARAMDLSRFDATEAFGRLRLRHLPEGAIVLLHEPQQIFRALGQRVERDERPDLTLVPLPLLHYPGMVDALLAQQPDLRDVLREYLLTAQLDRPALQTLASTHPVFLELDPRVEPALYDTLVPAGLLHQVLADGATEGDEREGARVASEAQRALYEALGPAPYDRPTRERLVWMHYASALYYTGFGDRPAAHVQLALALSLSPDSSHLLHMQRALEEAPEGPIDVAPFRTTTE